MKAVNGKEALERLSEFEPHIIFMDLRMPVMNGEETVKAIINQYGSNRFKIVSVTAEAFDHQQEKLNSWDVMATLRNPFTFPIFIIVLKNYWMRSMNMRT